MAGLIESIMRDYNVTEQDAREFAEFMLEMEKARSNYRPNQTINFYVDPLEGHDDYLMSLALCVKAAENSRPRVAVGGTRAD